jgi:hypothetical protein
MIEIRQGLLVLLLDCHERSLLPYWHAARYTIANTDPFSIDGRMYRTKDNRQLVGSRKAIGGERLVKFENS